jgi:hypothetical protein
MMKAMILTAALAMAATMVHATPHDPKLSLIMTLDGKTAEGKVIHDEKAIYVDLANVKHPAKDWVRAWVYVLNVTDMFGAVIDHHTGMVLKDQVGRPMTDFFNDLAAQTLGFVQPLAIELWAVDCENDTDVRAGRPMPIIPGSALAAFEKKLCTPQTK